MSFLSDLFARWRGTGERPSEATTDEKGWVTVDQPDGSRVTMDAETVAYLEHRGPKPMQESLAAMMAQARRVQVVRGGFSDHEVVLDVSNPIALSQLREALRVEDVKDGGVFHCMCVGDPWMRFLDPSGRQIAELSLHHGKSIRWSEWRSDAELVDGTASLKWMAERGLTYPAEEYNNSFEQNLLMFAAWERWFAAMPECLQPLLESMHESVGQVLFVPTPEATLRIDGEYDDPSSVDHATHRAVLRALAAIYPQSVERAGVLFEWLGSGQPRWSGFPEYEELPDHYLIRIPLESLTAALEVDPPSEARLAGAARFFAGYQFAAHRSQELQQLPDALRARLLDEGLRVDDEDRRKRARYAFERR